LLFLMMLFLTENRKRNLSRKLNLLLFFRRKLNLINNKIMNKKIYLSGVILFSLIAVSFYALGNKNEQLGAVQHDRYNSAGKYNENGVTLTNGEQELLQLDSAGNLKTTSIGTYATGTVAVGGTIPLRVDSNGYLPIQNMYAMSKDIDSISTREANYSYAYQDTAAANVVVKASAGYLKGIVIGTASSTATDIIEISDHASDGDGAVKLYLADWPVGTYEFNLYFATGISSDITAATNVTFIYE